MPALGLGSLADGFAIRHLRFADVGAHPKLPHHTVHDDLKVKLTHTADDGLAGIRIGVNFERRIFLRQPGQRDAHLFLVALGFRFYRHRDYWRGELNRFERDRRFFRTDGVAGSHILQTNAGADVASKDLADFFTLVGVHLQQAANALGPASGDIQHAVTSLQLS